MEPQKSSRCLVPVKWVKSAVIKNGRPLCHQCESELLSQVTLVDDIGRPIKGEYVPVGTKAVISWPRNMIDRLPEAETMFIFKDGVRPIQTTGYNDKDVFIEIDEEAIEFDRTGLMRWLSGQNAEKRKDVPQRRPLNMGQVWKPGEASFKI